MSKPIVIEKIKNLFIVVLFLSTVLLLYFFWGNISFDNLKPTAAAVSEGNPEISSVSLIKPDRVIVDFDKETYTVISAGQNNVWLDRTKDGGDCMVKELDRFGQAENILVEEMSYEQYQKVMNFRSIRAEFAYDIPAADFCRNFGIKDPKIFDPIETITSISYSTATDVKNYLFIYDGKNHKYYRLAADKYDGGFAKLIDKIEAEGYNSYYPINKYLGVSANSTPVPLTGNSNLKKIPYKQETYSYQTDKINEMAEKFFGGNFDFVRNIVEDKGTVIYMYGYGQIVLIVNTDGSIEYKEEQTVENKGQSFLDALNMAVKFVSDHGSWGPLESGAVTPYLKNVILNPGKEEGYQFIFGLEINGNRLYYEESEPIIVNVTEGQVTYYKRNMAAFEKKDLDASKTTAKEAFSSANLIAQNFPYLFEILLKTGVVSPSSDQDTMFADVASQVNNMQVGYVKAAGENENQLQPAWIITLDNKNIDVFFDLYDAEPIGYSIKQ